jgi:two-component system chemotaxis response regulator CheY
MVSSSGTQTHLKKALEAGACDFVQKPWKKEQILSILNKFSENKGA